MCASVARKVKDNESLCSLLMCTRADGFYECGVCKTYKHS